MTAAARALDGFRIATLSEQGGRASQQDATGIAFVAGTLFCVLADGAGGHEGGACAAQITVRTCLECFAAQPECTRERVAAIVDAAHAAVISAREGDPTNFDMHSTVVVVAAEPATRRVHWCHAGDSRLYLLREHRVHTRTRDHSLVQGMLDAQLITSSEAARHPRRNVLSSAIGISTGFITSADGQDYALSPDDMFLLCSDGFWSPVSVQRLEESLARAADPQSWLDELGNTIAACADPDQDNYSAIAFRLDV